MFIKETGLIPQENPIYFSLQQGFEQIRTFHFNYF